MASAQRCEFMSMYVAESEGWLRLRLGAVPQRSFATLRKRPSPFVEPRVQIPLGTNLESIDGCTRF